MLPLLPLLALLGAAAAATSVVVVTPATSYTPDALPECVTDGYHGSYAHPLRSIFLLSLPCFDSLNVGEVLEEAHIRELENWDEQTSSLLWIQRDQVEPSLLGLMDGEEDSIASVMMRVVFDAQKELQSWSETQSEESAQHVLHGLATGTAGVAMHYFAPDAALLAFPRVLPLPSLPPYASLYTPTRVPLLPSSPTSPRVSAVLEKGITFNPAIASILSSLSEKRILSSVRHLTGEDGLGILSRHSFSKGAIVAAEWIKAQIEASGAKCELWPFLNGYAPNVLCEYEPTTNSTDLVILSAHYDSRGSFGSTRAPGADDDGSGTSHLLGIAHAIHERGIKFERPVQLVAFAGEEQGLVGSRYYAQHLKRENASIALMIQADMLAYHSPSEPAQLGLPATIGSLDARELLTNLSKIYAPELTVGYTYACCSDHQSFHQLGYTATQVFERAGPIADPMYHNSGDLSNRTGYDVGQVKSIAKTTFAALLEVAGYEIAEPDEE